VKNRKAAPVMKREKSNFWIKSHPKGKIASLKEIATAIDKINSSPFYINILFNSAKFIKVFVGKTPA
jgi:hypothetical protein